MKLGLRRSVSLLTIAYGLGAAANVLINLLLGRALGRAGLGTYALANSIARVYYAATDAGLGTQLTRRVSRDADAASTLMSLFASLRVLLAPVGVALTAAVAVFLAPDDILVFALVATAQALVTLHVLYDALAQARQRMGGAAMLNIVVSVCTCVATATWYLGGGGLVSFGLAYAGALAVGVAAWALWSGRELGVRIRWRLSTRELAPELRRSLPIGLSFLLSIATTRAPVLLLGVVGEVEDVGAFTAVDLFVTSAAILQSAVTNATFPRLAAHHGKEPALFRRALWTSNAILASIGVVIAGGLTLFGNDLVGLLFADRQFTSNPALMPILACSTPALLLIHHNILVFAAADREEMNVRFMAAFLVVVAAMQVTLVPAYDVIGAAWGVTLARYIGLAGLAYLVFASKLHRGRAD